MNNGIYNQMLSGYDLTTTQQQRNAISDGYRAFIIVDVVANGCLEPIICQ